MSGKAMNTKLSSLFKEKKTQGEKRPASEMTSSTPENIDTEGGYGTRKHPKKQVVNRKKTSEGLTNPLQLVTSKSMFSATSFSELNINEKLVEVLKSPNVFHFTQPTVVQSYSIPVICKGGDVMIKSETGSGKTLSYLIPVVERLQGLPKRIDRSDGVYAIILVPTRELCVQIEETIKKLLLPFFWIVPTVICGGQKRKSEKSRLRKGANIIISTPGRFLDHALHTTSLSLEHVQMLVLDEADRLLDMGFDQQLKDILTLLKKQVTQPIQTVLLSATLSPQIQQLAALSLKSPEFLDADKLQSTSLSTNVSDRHEEVSTSCVSISSSSLDTSNPKDSSLQEVSTSCVSISSSSLDTSNRKDSLQDSTFQVPQQLRQYYIQIDCNLRLPALCAFLRKELRNPNTNHCRILIFVNTCDSVAFHNELFNELYWPNDGMDTSIHKGTLISLHGNMPQHERLKNLRNFTKANYATMICTDVAARGLDIPTVDWIIQYDPPTELSEYIHRVGRTARAGKSGQSLLFLQPSETGVLYTFQNKGLFLKQFNFDVWFDNCVRESGPGHQIIYAKRNHAASEIQATLLKTVEENTGLKDLAVIGFTSYCRAYATYSKELKTAFNVRSLHFGHVAKSFGLRETPKKISKKSATKAKKHTLQLANVVGEGSAQLDFGHTSEKKQRVFDAIKKEKEMRNKRSKKGTKGDLLKGKKKVAKLMSVNEWD